MQTHSKSDIAVTALRRAKKCYQEGDWISATILAGAAQRVLRDLCGSRDVESAIDTLSVSLGHSVVDIHNVIVSAYNSMKHAKHDATEGVCVSSAEPQALIVIAATDLIRLGVPHSPEVSEVLTFAASFNTGEAR